MPSRKSVVFERKDDLIVQKLGEEAIVYDRATHRAHSLNRTAALVFEKVDGAHDVAGIARDLGKALGRTQREEIVALAVNELAAAKLIQSAGALPRRTVLRGLAVGLLPVVASIAVPSAAAAASCASIGDSCYGGVVCCYPLVCQDFGSGFFECVDPFKGEQ